MDKIEIATDGSCIQQGSFAKGDDTDRPGASGFVARMPDGTMVGKAIPFANGTIGEMEIKGLRMGLEFAAAVADRTQDRITIKCDSQFVVNGFNDWLNGWAAKGYHKKGGLTGAEDWRAIDALKQSLGDRVGVQWVRGHSGDRLNEDVDKMVNGAARSQQLVDNTALVLDAASPSDRSPNTSVPTPDASIGTAGAKKGLQAQAAELLSKAADDPRLARLLAQGLEMALDETRLVARHDRDTVNQAAALQSVLQKRGEEL